MSGVERLEAAIAKLKHMRAASEPVRDDSSWGVDYDVSEDVRRVLVLDSHDGGHDGTVVAEATSEARAQLIVVLHRTIDAQLAVLVFGLDRARAKDYGDPGFRVKDQVIVELASELADAILGDAS